MSEFLKRITKPSAPVEREITINGEKGAVWVKRISASAKAAMLKGQRWESKPGSKDVFIVELEETERSKVLWVQACIVNADGSPFFASENAVNDLGQTDAEVIDKLHALARKVNPEGGDAKKS